MAVFDKLYKNYRKLMFGIAYDILKNVQDAEDAFFRIADNLDRINDEDSPQALNFAAVITRNVCLNVLRKRHIEDDIDDADVSSDMSTEDGFLADQGVETLERALRSLPEKYRDIMYLTVYEELKLRDAAELLGITYKTPSRALGAHGRKYPIFWKRKAVSTNGYSVLHKG